MAPPFPKKNWRHRRVLTEHVFDMLWSLDLSLGELEILLDSHAEVLEETLVGSDQVKELLFYVDWSRPLHVVVVVDDLREEERLITVYEPSTERWSADLRSRR